MIIKETVLYMKDNTGAMRLWGISSEDDVIVIRHGQVDGSMQYKTEYVVEGKATRSRDEQIMSRMASRIKSQQDKGYITNYFTAEKREHSVNAMGLRKPMLAHKIKDAKNIDYTDAIVQPKFDGNRCLIYCENGINRAYSRNGKPVEAIQHILDDLEPLGDLVLDGELYCHGQSLQTIVSWIKRKQENTLKIKYHLYDIVAPDLPYKRRSDLIRGLPIGSSIEPVYGSPATSYGDVLRAFREYREQGYEGAILRWGQTGYEDGKRSKSLLKVKEWESEEFLVLDVIPSSDGWGILECSLPHYESFNVSAPGTIEQKTEILVNKDHYVGRMVTVEFANYTKDGVPFHPIAIAFRDDLD